MLILRAFGEGIRKAYHSFTIIAILYGVNIVLAAITALLFKSAVSSALSGSIAPERLMQGFDFTVYIDFITKHPGRLTTVYSLITWIVVIANFLCIFFDGGIIAALQPGSDKFTLKSFFASCGEYVGRFLRLFLIVALVLFVCAFLLSFVSVFLYSLIAGDGETEMQVIRAAALVVLVFLLPISVVILIADYARVITVVEDKKSMFRVFWEGTKFVFKHITSTYGLFLLCFILTAILFLCWGLLTTGITANTGGIVLWIFVVQQIIIIGRVYIRIAAIGGQVEIYYGSVNLSPEETRSVPQPLPQIEEKPQVVPTAHVIPEGIEPEMKIRKKLKKRVIKRRIVVKSIKKKVQQEIRKRKK